MLLAGVMHFVSPDFYTPFIPKWLPFDVVNLSTGVVEVLFGLGLFFPKFRKMAALGCFLLMIVFLPIHVNDVIVADPAIGSKVQAWIRLPIQFVFLFWMWWVYKKTEK